MFCLLHVNREQLLWNKSLLLFDSIHTISKKGKKFDITYALAAPNGPVSSRDFIDLRTWERREFNDSGSANINDYPVNNASGEIYITAGISVADFEFNAKQLLQSNAITKSLSPVRGENNAGGHVLFPVYDSNRQIIGTRCVWLMCSDLKGWMSQWVVNQALSSVLYNFNVNMRHLIQNKENLKMATRSEQDIFG